MSKLKGSSFCFALLLCSLAMPASAQYMYLDANGDGVNSAADSLNATGPTLLTIYLDTNHDRDGTLRSCNGHTGAPSAGGPINLFGYTIVLKAVGGTVTWGAFTPLDPTYTPLGADLADSTDTQFTRMRPAQTFTAAGLLQLGTISVTSSSGTPGIVIGTSTQMDPFGFGTDFATQCEGSAYPNSYMLGTDWFDTDGVRAPSGHDNQAPQLSGPVEMNAVAGTGFTSSIDVTDPELGDATTVTVTGLPSGLSLEQGKAPNGHTVATVRGLIENTASAWGEHSIVWSVTDGLHPPITALTRMRVSKPLDTGPDLETRVREFVSRPYPHALPRNAARTLGPAAVPILENLLRDERFKGQWRNVVEALAIIGTPATFDTLRAFVWNRFTGKVDRPTSGALFVAQVTMWSLASTRPDVLDYLSRCANPQFWRNVPWTWSYGPEEGFGLVMSEVSINGISCLTSHKALEVLENIRQHPYDPNQAGNIKEGLARQREILRVGYDAYLGARNH